MTIDLKDIFNADGSQNTEMVSHILSAIKSNAADNTDYLKFKQSVDNLQNMGMDEPTSIKSAFATLNTLGITKDKVLASIRHYNVVLDKEKEKFATALKNQIAQQIDKPKLDSEKIDNHIAQLEKQIQKIQNEITQYRAKQETIPADIANAEAKITKTRDEFSAVYSHFSQTLDNDKILIEQLG